jgi:hypothetical protein
MYSSFVFLYIDFQEIGELMKDNVQILKPTPHAAAGHLHDHRQD